MIPGLDMVLGKGASLSAGATGGTIGSSAFDFSGPAVVYGDADVNPVPLETAGGLLPVVALGIAMMALIIAKR